MLLREVLPVGSVLCVWSAEECPEDLIPFLDQHNNPVMVALTTLDVDLRSMLDVLDDQPIQFRSADGLNGIVWYCDVSRCRAEGLIRELGYCDSDSTVP